MRLLAILISLMALLATEFAKADGWKPNPGPAPFPIQVQVLRVIGTGCPKGTISATLSPDQTTLSVLFDQLGTQVPAGTGFDRKQCSITLGVKFIGKYRVAIIGSDIRGFASVPAQARSTISIEHRSVYSYMTTNTFTKNLIGPSEENIEMVNRFPNKPMWSQCGTQMKYSSQTFPFMVIRMDISSQNQNPSQDLVAMIDSFDFSAAPLSYQIAWMSDKSCPN